MSIYNYVKSYLNSLSTRYVKARFGLIECYRRNGMKIGRDCCIYSEHFLPECYLIEIGDHVQITNGVHIFTHGGGWCLREKFSDYDSFAKVTIGNNVYIGNNALIMPGIKIGSNVIIAAGTVVTKNVPDDVVIAGNPAKIIRSYDSYIEKYSQFNLHCKHMNESEKKNFLSGLNDDNFYSVSSYLN